MSRGENHHEKMISGLAERVAKILAITPVEARPIVERNHVEAVQRFIKSGTLEQFRGAQRRAEQARYIVAMHREQAGGTS